MMVIENKEEEKIYSKLDMHFFFFFFFFVYLKSRNFF